MLGCSAAQPSAYYHAYLYTGGTAPAMNDITSDFVGSTVVRTLSMNASGQMAGSLGYDSSGVADIYSGGLSGTTIVLPVPPGCSAKLAPLGIDNAGEVGGVGETSSGSPPYVAAVYTAGAAYTLDQPPLVGEGPHASQSWVDAMSPNGAYAVGQWGFCYSTPGLPVGAACYWTPKSGSWANGGTFNDISLALSGGHGEAGSIAVAVNNSGQVVCTVGPAESNDGLVGSGCPASIYNINTGLITSLGSVFELSPQLGPETFTEDSEMQQTINASGQVVGFEVVGGVNHAAVWQNGTITDLNTLYAASLPSGFVLNTATAIDDQGDIAGYGTDSLSHIAQAFLLKAFLPGDANRDGKVDIGDLTIVLANYGRTGMGWSQGEFTGDGTVNINDLTIVLAHYGQSIGSSAAGLNAVPEPSMLAMFAAGLVGLLACAWRRLSGGTP
jgi:probable HAF family extracellular repeat protein